MNKIEISRFDVADYLDSEEMINAYLNETLEEGTPAEFVKALNTVARAKKMRHIAEKSGIGRTTLYRSLQSDKPRFETLAKVLDALGLRLMVVSKTYKD